MPVSYLVVAAADVALTAFAREGRRRLRWFTKPMLMPTLAWWVRSHRGRHRPVMLRRTWAALGLSAAGDVALLRKDDTGFLAGLGAFLGAHVAYLAAFDSARRRTSRTEPVMRRVWPAAALWASATAVLAPRSGTMRAPVLLYTTAIASMLGTALLADGLPDSARRRILTGASCFVLSDGLIGVDKFLLAESHEAGSTREDMVEAAVMASYTLAQWLIADGVVRATRDRS